MRIDKMLRGQDTCPLVIALQVSYTFYFKLFPACHRVGFFRFAVFFLLHRFVCLALSETDSTNVLRFLAVFNHKALPSCIQLSMRRESFSLPHKEGFLRIGYYISNRRSDWLD